MKRTMIERRVELPAKNLDSNFKKHILAKIRFDTANECTKKYGYIIKVYNNIEILENEGTIFKVRFQAKTLMPVKGEKLSGIICMVYDNGIFIEIEGKQKALVSKLNLPGYVFNDENKTFTKGKHVLKENLPATVLIKNTRYSDGKYSCFGTLV
jgi:DNA-directed RNA polymerase subunit E'/Rpb7